VSWIIGGVITWALALTPVVVLRYLVLKRPVGRWPAIGLGALTSLVHAVVFALLGVTKLRPVGAVVGFVAYEILHAGYEGAEEKRTADDQADDAAAVVPSTQLYAEGCRLADAGDYTAAVDALTRCTKADPDNAEAWHNRGCCLYELGRPSEAIASYSQALMLHPGAGATLFARGLAREATGAIEAAAADFELYLSHSGEVDQGKATYASGVIDRARNQRALGLVYPERSPVLVRPAGTSPAVPIDETGSGRQSERAVALRLGSEVRGMSVLGFRAAVTSGQVSAQTEVMSSFLFGDGNWRKVGETRTWREMRQKPERVGLLGRSYGA